jgi:hypothetical protein
MCTKNYRKQVKKGLKARGPAMRAIWDFFQEKHAGVTTSRTAFKLVMHAPHVLMLHVSGINAPGPQASPYQGLPVSIKS